ncbi:MAG: PilN domain-containing protein [Fimbriimonadaceae bacterium]|nr:PilN domain-containing protein [Fimbriimonadaceae bacterium]QYK56001.1 MAG: PilN domain-containing protein [Fimbriimonadaceae bacterium]
MPMINLIQEQRLAIQEREQKIRALLFATVGLGALAFLCAGFFTFEAARYQVMVMSLSGEKQRLQPQIDKYQANLKEMKELEPRIESLGSAVKATERWFRVMDHLSYNTPNGVWLTQVRSNSNDASKGVVVTVDGYGLTQEQIGELLIRLGTCPDLANVSLKFSQERPIDQQKVLEFEILATLTGTEVKKTVAEKKKESA